MQLVLCNYTNLQLQTIVTKPNISSNGHGLLGQCCDVGLLILNGRTPGDELREFNCLANGGVTLSIILLVHL